MNIFLISCFIIWNIAKYLLLQTNIIEEVNLFVLISPYGPLNRKENCLLNFQHVLLLEKNIFFLALRNRSVDFSIFLRARAFKRLDCVYLQIYVNLFYRPLGML